MDGLACRQTMPFLSTSLMNGFSRLFLNEDWKGLPDAPRFYLSGFGKHPGWNDHLDDIGLATSSLIDARRILYGGLAHQIESAAWDKAGPDKVAPGFDHVIHWTRMGETLTGLMWSSQDGKGRSLYPMSALAHSVGQPFEWVANTVLPALEDTAAKCRSTTSADKVINLFGQTQQSLRNRSVDVTQAPFAVSSGGVRVWAAYFSREQVALRRVLHHIRGNFGPFAPGCLEWCEGEKKARSCSMRLPQIPGTKPAESLNAWLSFLATQVDPAIPILGLLPMDRNWVDLIVGEPGPEDFFVLRALPAAVPLVTDIPYQLDAEMQGSFAGIFEDLASGRLPGNSCFNGESVGVIREASARWLARFRPSDKSGFFSRFL